MEFGRQATILVGENGMGKTTVLNALYALLSLRLRKIAGLRFDELVLTPQKGRQVRLRPDALEACGVEASDFLERFGPWLSPGVARKVLDYLKLNGARGFHKSAAFDLVARRLPSHMRIELARYVDGLPSVGEVDTTSLREQIRSIFPYQVLYFPTYRRVEEELHQLGYPEDLPATNEQLIHFGMTDVQERFEKVTASLRESAAKWYATTSGRMLSQLIDGINVSESDFERLQNRQALGIVLERVGGGIDAGQRLEILSLVESNRIRDEQYRSLVYFLSNLVLVYDQQRDQDARIKRFAEVANRYLIDKHVVYDERAVSIRVIDSATSRKVELGRLSSGEKQMLSMLSRLYLSNEEHVGVIVDEPELSLSVEWQRTLLPDVLDSGKVALLVAATHSPFIFENKLDQDACPLTIARRVGEIVPEAEGEGG